MKFLPLCLLCYANVRLGSRVEPRRLLGPGAVLNTTFALLTLGGMGLAGVAGDVLDIVPVINIQGYGYVAAGILALALLWPRPALFPPDGERILVQNKDQA